MLGLKYILVLAFFHLSSGAKLPDIFKKCPRNAVNLSKCIEDNANIALPHVLKGVEDLNIPPLTNLEVPKIYAPNYVPYDFIFEGNITKLEGVTYNNSVFDLKNLVAHAKLIFPKVELEGKYKMHGFVGKIPMSGKGPGNVTLHNVTLEVVWTFVLFHHHGADYFKEVSASLISYNVSSISYQFGNLFNGDKIQEEMANQILNKYWWILAGNFIPNIPVYLIELIYNITSKVHSNNTLEDVFP